MDNLNLTVYSYLVLGLLGAVVLLVCWVVYLHMSISQIRKTLFSVSDNFNDIDSVINMVHGFGKRWDYVTKAISDLQMSQEQSSVRRSAGNRGSDRQNRRAGTSSGGTADDGSGIKNVQPCREDGKGWFVHRRGYG